MDEMINNIIGGKYTTLMMYSITNGLNYFSIFQLVKKTDIRFFIVDGRTKLYFIEDLNKICEGLRIKKTLKDLKNNN